VKALTFDGPGQRSWSDVPMPAIIDSTDAIVKVDLTTICGSDLHILRGDVPEVTPGRVLGHEAVGTVVEVGSGVRRVRAGDRVLVSCITSCGACEFCRRAHFGQCVGGGGWILGHLIDGTQAEFVRIPFADTSTYALPDGVSDERMLMIADILPTAYEVGVLSGTVHPGDSVVVVGAGPVGLAAIMTSRLVSPEIIIAIDLDDERLARAKQFGADVTMNNTTIDPVPEVMKLTGGLGAHVTIEAVGLPATFELAASLVRPVGHVANIGVHGQAAPLHLESLWSHDVTITTGLVDAFSTPTLIRLVKSGQIAADDFITHRMSMDDMLEAYDVFEHAADTGALKVAIGAGPRRSP
jgi:alcohol dehydrogenase